MSLRVQIPTTLAVLWTLSPFVHADLSSPVYWLFVMGGACCGIAAGSFTAFLQREFRLLREAKNPVEVEETK